jgi:hypothetical protein
MSNTLRLTEEQFSTILARRKSRKPAAPKKARLATGDENSRLLAGQLELAGFPAPTLEYRFAAPRKWRADLAYPDKRLLIEIDGAVHRIKARFKADLARDQAIFFMSGWRKLRVSPAQVRSGEALELVKRALA